MAVASAAAAAALIPMAEALLTAPVLSLPSLLFACTSPFIIISDDSPPPPPPPVAACASSSLSSLLYVSESIFGSEAESESDD